MWAFNFYCAITNVKAEKNCFLPDVMLKALQRAAFGKGALMIHFKVTTQLQVGLLHSITLLWSCWCTVFT